MGFADYLGNKNIVTALRGMLRAARVPNALLFTGPRGVGKYTLARMFAQAANCERMTDDFCGECAPCRSIAELALKRSGLEWSEAGFSLSFCESFTEFIDSNY